MPKKQYIGIGGHWGPPGWVDGSWPRRRVQDELLACLRYHRRLLAAAKKITDKQRWYPQHLKRAARAAEARHQRFVVALQAVLEHEKR